MTVTTDGNGSASADPASGPAGSLITLSAKPNDGFTFKEWQVLSGGVSISGDKFTLGTENVEIRAVFERSAVPMDLIVDGTNFTNTGAKGVPPDIASTTFKVTILIMEDGEVVSRAENVELHIFSGVAKFRATAHFDRTVEDLSGGTHPVVITGLPDVVYSVPPINQRYVLTHDAWIDKNGAITVYLKWDDGKRSEPEIIRIYALPEDEIGAYKLREDGTKEYLIFHTYDICMYYLGNDELCRGYERCFHKEHPYVNPFAQGGLIEEIRRYVLGVRTEHRTGNLLAPPRGLDPEGACTRSGASCAPCVSCGAKNMI